MELKDALRNRKSYRFEFTDRKVTRDELKYMMEAAYLAPSGCNLQSLRVVGVLDEDKIKKLGEIFGFAWAQSATAVIVLLTKEVAMEGRGPSRYREDFGAASQNLWLAVTDLGFATTWIQGQIDNEKGEAMEVLLNVPEDYTITGYFPIGEPSREAISPKKMPFDERCFLDEYGKTF